MLNLLSFESRVKYRNPFFLFILFVIGQLCIFLVGSTLLLGLFGKNEFEFGVIRFGLVFIAFHFTFCFMEYFFHRYILHTATSSSLKSITLKHDKVHHSLTRVVFQKSDASLNSYQIHSEYAIQSLRQDTSSTFPWWALLAFLGGFTPIFIILKIILPELPIFLGGYTALSFTYFLYEGLHALHHNSNDWWKKKIQKRLIGRAWLEVYIFHKAHHANTECNMSVSGFFGLPISDWVFGTYKRIIEFVSDGMIVREDPVINLRNNSSIVFIRWLDRVAQARESKVMHKK